jgi:hypothetical protein
VRVVARAGTGAALAVATRLVCLTVRVAVVVVWDGVSVVAGDTALLSAAGVPSAGAVAGAGSVETGCASWAGAGVEESASAAAIAGRTLVRGKTLLIFVIMPEQPPCGASSRTIIVAWTPNADEAIIVTLLV